MNAVNFHLEGQVAVITGAAQGIGAACAERLSQDGAAVALWDLDDARGEALAHRRRERGRRALYLHCDVSDKGDVDAAVAATLQDLGHIDALVNNAGIFKAANFLDITEADWDAVLGSEEARQRIMSRTPMKRLGEPHEIAAVCAFLVSRASSYMTGAIVYVDGGRMTLNYTVTP